MNRVRLREQMDREVQLFESRNPRSRDLAQLAQQNLVSGVPMPWMARWPGPFPVFFQHAAGATFHDVDGHEYVDFCLGDTGAMTGHALPQVAEALHRQASAGITTMLPNDDSVWVAQELSRRFGLPKWQFAMTATDANRFVLRFSRHLTKRPKIAVIDWCYHGTVDETLAVLDHDGSVIPRPGALGPAFHPRDTTVVIPFNDLVALEKALAVGDVACLLMEPALTNIGIVLPEDGYLASVRDITRRHGVLLIIDETHTICAGPGGCTREWNLEPDFFVIGKPIGGGMPAAVYGMSADVAERLEKSLVVDDVDVSGVGGTLTGNALAMAAIRATLSSTLLQSDFDYMIPLATEWTKGVRDAYTRVGFEWHVQQLGCRAEYWFCPPPKNGRQAAESIDHDLDAYLHLFCLNRGILLTPFHNMALMSPSHNKQHVHIHTEVFNQAMDTLVP
ncbi:MAG: aspartate aminotransferase family protein [Ilumatobacteraceae bacterium]|jgi:glutamate-1-semialdehyde 2,1-aminomutase|nr:aspartate aminotransferase family protein [Ilumatobacteraceae bacterium]